MVTVSSQVLKGHTRRTETRVVVGFLGSRNLQKEECCLGVGSGALKAVLKTRPIHRHEGVSCQFDGS